MNRFKFFIPLVIVAGIGIILSIALHLDPSKLPSALIGKPFPQFALPELLDEGRLISEKDLVGKVALVNVWATWCITCRVEHPYLVKLAQEYNIPIYGVNYKDDAVAAREWLLKNRNPYIFNIVDAKGDLGVDLGVTGAPETFVIDKNGRIHHKRTNVVDMRIWQEELKPVIDRLQHE